MLDTSAYLDRLRAGMQRPTTALLGAPGSGKTASMSARFYLLHGQSLEEVFSARPHGPTAWPDRLRERIGWLRDCIAGLQKAIAVDYATNIAAAMQILADKWNEVHAVGQTVTVNNDDPSVVENWFTAVWNYNLGFNPAADAGKNAGYWGLGWYNNPANPLYKKSWGHPFMDTDVDGPTANKDAAHPQDWPYEEKVMGWAALSIDTGFSYGTDGRQDWPGDSGFNSAGFQPAWWISKGDRSSVSPPLDAFCNTKNNCDPNVPPNCPNKECYKQYWWNQPNVTWKVLCATTCGHENIKYQTLISEPGQGHEYAYSCPARPSWWTVTVGPDVRRRRGSCR